MLDARPFALAEDPLLRSTTDRIAAQLHVAPPKLCLIDDGFPRAFVVGRGPGGATLAVSTGLLRVARREELEAVIAHELAHVRSLDVLTQTFAVLLATTLVEASRLGGFLSRALLFVLGPDRRRVHPRAAVAAARVCGRPRRRERLRPARPRRRAPAPRQGCRARVVRGVAGDGAPLPRSTRSSPTGSPGCSTRTRRSPSGCGGCGRSAARPRAGRRMPSCPPAPDHDEARNRPGNERQGPTPVGPLKRRRDTLSVSLLRV